jgi:membrane-bound lytic murein transglycosylase MltF
MLVERLRTDLLIAAPASFRPVLPVKVQNMQSYDFCLLHPGSVPLCSANPISPRPDLLSFFLPEFSSFSIPSVSAIFRHFAFHYSADMFGGSAMLVLMKRLNIYPILLLLLAAACSKSPTEPAATSQETAAPAKAEQPSESAGGVTAEPEGQNVVSETTLNNWKGDLDGMIQRRFIRVLTTYSRTNYFVDKGTQRGLVADTAAMFEEDLNKKLKNKHIRVQVMILPVSHDELLPALLEGRGDIIAAGTLVTDLRKEQVDFTNPTQTGVSVVAVTGPGAPPVSKVEDLAGRELYLQMSATSPKAIERFNAELAKKGLPPVRIKAAPESLAEEDILEMVNAGIVHTTLSLGYLADFWKQVFPNIVFNTSAAVKAEAQTAMMIRKNSPLLKAELNAFLARYPEGSTQRNMLFQKYLKSLKYVKEATSESEKAKFLKTISLFQKYGDKYSLDYLLMAAQGYQESQLNQNVKSRVGAIGIMQLMPATGKEMKVGDVRQLEPNIHAGVKYIRFMMDQYYKDEPMERLDKGLFTFASYNAGPGRISQLRKRATARRLDPNKWFNNVEVLAAESIGRETVQYVSNIYKYYLAYQMLTNEQQERLKVKKETVGKK